MKIITIISFLSILILSSCVSVLYIKFADLEKNLPMKEVISIIESDINSDTQTMFILNSLKEDTHDISNDIPNIKILLIKRFNVAIKTGLFYVLAFENDKLIYWASPLDFTKSDDAKIEKIGIIVSDIINTQYKQIN